MNSIQKMSLNCFLEEELKSGHLLKTNQRRGTIEIKGLLGWPSGWQLTGPLRSFFSSTFFFLVFSSSSFSPPTNGHLADVLHLRLWNVERNTGWPGHTASLYAGHLSPPPGFFYFILIFFFGYFYVGYFHWILRIFLELHNIVFELIEWNERIINRSCGHVVQTGRPLWLTKYKRDNHQLLFDLVSQGLVAYSSSSGDFFEERKTTTCTGLLQFLILKVFLFLFSIDSHLALPFGLFRLQPEFVQTSRSIFASGSILQQTAPILTEW